jgi:hypothetical protein
MMAKSRQISTTAAASTAAATVSTATIHSLPHTANHLSNEGEGVGSSGEGGEEEFYQLVEEIADATADR